MARTWLAITGGSAVLSLSVAFAVPLPTQGLVFPHVVVGGGWECDLTVLNQGAEDATGTISFFLSDGSPMEVFVGGSGPKTSIDFQLLWRSAKVFRISGGSTAAVGYAIGEQSSTSDHGSISGLLTYRFRQGGATIMQVGVKTAPRLFAAHIPYDNVNGNRTAIAILSPDRAPVTLRRYDDSGAGANRVEINFTYHGIDQAATFVDDLFPSAQQQTGFLRVEGEEGFYALVLNQNNLLLSTGDAVPAIVERTLHLDAEGVSDWTVRLAQTGESLSGIAQMQPGDSPTELISGSFSNGTLHLLLSRRAGGAEADRSILLSGQAADLDAVSGTAVMVASSGVVGAGSFSLSRPDSAQY
jgi:murein DD-endopeptidase MepM/ murein hydrolase activator NlpD